MEKTAVELMALCRAGPERLDERMAAARAALTDDIAFAALQEGRGTTLEHAIDLARRATQ